MNKRSTPFMISILVLSLSLAVGCSTSSKIQGALPTKNPPVTFTPQIAKNVIRNSKQSTKVESLNSTQYQGTPDEYQVIQLTNVERQKVGLSPLQMNPTLMNMARAKAADMVTNNYFDHISPTYGSPFDMMSQWGISLTAAGENIAGNQTVVDAMNAWMNSPGHRANILNSQYSEIGVGVVDGGPYGKMLVQEFIHP